jgi:hypothetical protein
MGLMLGGGGYRGGGPDGLVDEALRDDVLVEGFDPRDGCR